MIKIICVGKIKEKNLQELINDYLKRLRKYIKVEIKEVSDENDNNDGKLLEKEQKNIKKYINKNDYVIVLDIKGKQLSSELFSKTLEDLFIRGKSDITFIIGSSYGLSDDLKKEADFNLSFSTMTFPHQVFRLLLVEQIYRAFKIIKNETYHK